MRTVTVLLPMLLLFSTLQSCAVLGPDYQEPSVTWLDKWQTDLYGQVAEENGGYDDLSFWWQAFEDPTLNQLIEIAHDNNPGLRIAGLSILQSRALLGIATGSKYPQVQQATGSALRADSWPTEGENSGDHSNVTSYNLGFNVGWELDFWGQFQRSIESANSAFFSSITNQQNVQVLLNAQVAQTYYSYRTTVRQIEIAKQNAKLQKRSLEITRRLYDQGQDSELDLQQAKTQYLSTLSSIPNLEITLKQVSNALCVLLGRSPGNLPELQPDSSDLPALEPKMIREIPASLLMRRPDIRTAAWQVAAQSAQIGVAEADLYPAISLVGNIGWSGNSLSSTADTLTLGFGPSFTWNLFNYGRLKNNVRVQDALFQQTIESYQNTVLQAAQEIDNAAISVVKTREQGEILADALTAAERSLKLASSRYREGYSDFNRVLDAQRAVAAQSGSYVANQGSHINAVIAFYKALGGGWQVMPVEELLDEETRLSMEERTDWGELLTAPLPDPNSNNKGKSDE